ncbi:MAG TPA: ABC transporter substrate-binding protein [Candidatus Kapabacteria bacterium]|nr:ABC transporter substrate-binding protein [Candidatus Kapabacteria bacterium]
MMPRFRHAAISLGALALLAFTAVSCGRGNKGQSGEAQGPVGDPVNGDWVIIHDLADPESLNLITASDATSQEIFNNYMYDALYFLDPFKLELTPWVADSMPVVSPDHLTYDIVLKKTAKFSDGQPVTGEDFIFYLKMIKNPLILKAAPLRGYFTRLKSLELVNGDKYHLRATMNEPYYLADQFIGGLYAFPKHVWDPTNQSDKISWAELNDGSADKNPAAKCLADEINDNAKGFDKKYLVASGPYMFNSFERNAKLELVRNPNYWNKDNIYGKAYPDKIIYRTITDQNSAVSAMKNGEIDMYPVMEKVNFHNEEKKLPEFGMKPAVYDYPAFTYIGYNEHNEKFKERNVRMALSLLMDRDALIKTVYFGLARPVQSPIYYKRPEYDSTLAEIKFDPEAAKKLLDAAGWIDSDGDGIRDKVIDGKKTDFTFEILLNTGNKRREATALIFIDALRKVGISAKTMSLEWATFLQKTRDGDYDAYVGGWAESPQEGDLYQIWHSKSAEQGGSNYIKYSNPAVDSLIEKIRGEFDFAKRKEMYVQIQKHLYEDQPYTFLTAEKLTGAYSQRFQNVQFFAPRPCYNSAWWWSPLSAQKYKAAAPTAMR